MEKTQDRADRSSPEEQQAEALHGRKLRRYKRRWIIERINAWPGQFRRLLVRHEPSSHHRTALFSILSASGVRVENVLDRITETGRQAGQPTRNLGVHIDRVVSHD